MRCVKWLLPALMLASTQGAADENVALDPAAIDRLARRAMNEFQVPGMAIGVVQGGETLYAAGHGRREAGRTGAVDAETLFRIASASKAFTSAAVAILVDQGRVSWDGAVSDYLPELRMSDPWVTGQLSLTDLLAHRSGLTPHAGDLLLWPVPNEFSTADIVGALRYFSLDSGFRRGYTYDNLLYIVAGEAVARVSGQRWGEFVDARVMAPLGMTRCFAGRIPETQMRNLAAPHAEVDGALTVIERNRIPEEPSKFAPAGGIACSLRDMLIWVGYWLDGDGPAGGGALFSAAQRRTMWAPHNWLGVGSRAAELDGTNFSAYGLGWRLRDVQGVLEVSHTGSLDGWRAHALMLPEQDVGIVVLANGSSTTARNAVMRTIEYAFLPTGQRDWIDYYRTQISLAEQRARAAEREPGPEPPADETGHRAPPRAPGAYAGRYRDPWFGDIVVTERDGRLSFAAEKSPRLSGPMTHHSGDVFIARWQDRSLGMDAYVRFEFDESDRVRRVRMKRWFEDGEGGLDHYEYLEFSPVEDNEGAMTEQTNE